MKKQFNKIRKCTMELAALAAFKNKQPVDFTEDDLDILAESIEVLNTVYETLYDKVFVEIEEI